jgi:hypothetical protein
MGVEIKSNQITGISTVSNYSDAANKNYVDTSPGITTTSDDGSRLFIYSNGITQSWEPIGAYQEYTSPGNYTFTVPTQAKELFIEATGAGGGGGSGTTDDSTFITEGIYWVTRINTTRVVNTLIYGGGYYVSGGGALTPGTRTGEMYVSADTVTWTLRTSSNINGINASTYKTSADNPYVVAGYGPLEWTQRTSGTSQTLFNNVQPGGVYDGTNYFICGTSGVLTASTNAITWTLRTAGFASLGLFGISYFSGATFPYLAGGQSGSLNVSTDGITWTLRTSGTGLYVGGFAYKSTPSVEYLASGGSGLIATSTDTITWTLRTAGSTASSQGAIYYNSQYYVPFGASIRTSTNGINWSARTTSGATTLYSVYSDGTNLISHGGSGRFITSTDGVIWVLRTSGFGTTDILASAYGNNIYTIGGASGLFASSTDTITWTRRNSSFGTTQINGIIYGNNTYVMAGQTGTLTTSTSAILSTYGTGAYLAVSSDTITWTLRTTGINTQDITALVSNSSFYVAGAQNSIGSSNIIVSTDSINWVVRTTPFTFSANDINNRNISNIIYDGSTYFVAGTGRGQYAVSTDTVIWILRTTGFGSDTNSTNAVAYGLIGSTPTYVAAGSNISASGASVLATSTDTITWVLRTSGGNNSFSLGYNNGIFMLGITNGIVSSTDTITWILRTSGMTSGSANSIIYATNSWVAGGSNSTSGRIVAAPNPGGFAGSGGGGGATVSWNISKAYITGSSLTVNVGQGGSAGQTGAASTVSWTGNSGTYSLTANGGSGGSNTYTQATAAALGGAGGTIPPTTSNYLTATAGTSGGSAGLFGVNFSPTAGTDATTGFQATGGGGGNYTGGTAVASGIIYYYNNTTSSSAGAAATAITGLSYGNGGGGGTAGSAGGSGVKGGGGGGGGYDSTTDTAGTGGAGGDGYVRISWQ